jgi:3-phenylpropionate/trans-cinnamate dioxygenase ferredoxin reductase subunit
MRIVLVGGGVAAAATAMALRRRGYDGAITLVAGEPEPPYQRPPLSKDFLTAGSDPFPACPPGWYADHDVELRLGTRADALDLDRRRVLAGGDELAYDSLVLATGLRARTLPGFDGERVHHLRTAADARRLRDELAAAERLVILGAGFIGCEVAASAVALGKRVTILEPEPAPLARALGARIGGALVGIHRDRGVDLRTGEYATSMDRTADGLVLTTNLGDRVAGDLVLVGVGARPNVELAEAAGIATGNGILVDEYGRTSAPDVWALGDVAAQLHHGVRVRVEHHDNAQRQGTTVAANLTGDAVAHTDAHWFWSDQYEHKLQSVGRPRDPEDLVVRGDLASGRFSAFSLTGGRIDAVIALGRPGDVLAVRRVLHLPHEVSAEELRDESVPLKDLLAAATARQARAAS